VCLPDQSYHAVLAVKDEGGERPRRLRRSSILDRCARRDRGDAGNRAQAQIRGSDHEHVT
jgi:hypothetical protein